MRCAPRGGAGGGVAADPAGAAYVAGDASSDQGTFPVRGGPDLAYDDGPRVEATDAVVGGGGDDDDDGDGGGGQGGQPTDPDAVVP